MKKRVENWPPPSHQFSSPPSFSTKNRFLHRTWAHKIAFFPDASLYHLPMNVKATTQKKSLPSFFSPLDAEIFIVLAEWCGGGSEWNLKMEHRKWMQGRGWVMKEGEREKGIYFPLQLKSEAFFCSSFSIFFHRVRI